MHSNHLVLVNVLYNYVFTSNVAISYKMAYKVNSLRVKCC